MGTRRSELIDKLTLVRIEFGKPIIITDGFRCSSFQELLRAKGLKTAAGKSTHELGHAADIKSQDPSDLQNLLLIVKKYFKAVGIAKTFLHVDIRTDKERTWSY
jgi:zinc D-Ala-D-Ala carboxypeptidase